MQCSILFGWSIAMWRFQKRGQNAPMMPVHFRIKYKILLLTYKRLNGKAPQYLAFLLEEYAPCRTLRSSIQCLLKEKKDQLKSSGDKAFSVAAPWL